jgi:hypothetical protein
MPAPETGKQRASRIPLDYYKRPNALDRWKNGLAAVALVVPIGWVASGWLRSDGGQLAYSRGPVASVHATWEENCTACHTPFTPIGGNTWATPILGQVHTSDEKCQTCHAGEPHHKSQMRELSCAACHHDHRGRDASLVRLADADCTQCHSDLAANTKEANPHYVNVDAFSTHPPIRVLRGADPGKLKFNHKLHLTLGMRRENGDPVWTVGMIQPSDRKRYGKDDREPVQLTCASCHQVDSGDFDVKPDQPSIMHVAARSTTRSPGAYMVPITYENHCRACHPLTLNSKSPDERNAIPITIPHGLQPEEVRDFVWGALANQRAANMPELRDWIRRPMPGKDPSQKAEETRKAIDQEVNNLEKALYPVRLGQAERILFGGKQTCSECHAYEDHAGPVPKRVEATALRDMWFDHAVFNHTAHRAVECTACHERANQSTESIDVLLPNIDNCQKCHKAGGGGARSDCTGCHRYHNGDNPRQGIGAAKRDPRKRLSIEQLLAGSAPPE